MSRLYACRHRIVLEIVGVDLLSLLRKKFLFLKNSINFWKSRGR
jgi:hypothetical protein